MPKSKMGELENDNELKRPGLCYDFVYVNQESFEKYRPKTFQHLLENFIEYK
jgi:hypothetical protein